MEIRSDFCVIIKNIKDKVHVDDADRNLPKVFLIIPEQAICHSNNPGTLSESPPYKIFMHVPDFQKIEQKIPMSGLRKAIAGSLMAPEKEEPVPLLK